MLLLFLATAMADTTAAPDPGPVGVVQATPGLHLGYSGGRLGLGLSVDALGGVVFGDRDFNIAPGVVAGPFAEVNLWLGGGVEVVAGGRVGGGALAPTAVLGYVPYGMLTVDYGAVLTDPGEARKGLHVRALYGGLGLTRDSIGRPGVTLGAEFPLLPVPVVF